MFPSRWNHLCANSCIAKMNVNFVDIMMNPKVETQPSMPDCCGSQNLKNMECQLTCVACGQVVGEEYKTEYINFHANLFKIYKKTVYNRKYHLSHTLDKIILKNKIEISCSTNFQNS